MERIRTLIIEDEPPTRAGIRRLLEGEPGIDVVGECADGEAALRAIQELSPDLVVLDVQMPGRDGFNVLQGVGPEAMPAVIFVTRQDAEAVRALDTHEVDYVRKPVEPEEFRQALRRARSLIRGQRSRESDTRLLALLAEMQSRSPYVERFVVKAGGRLLLLEAGQIDWIEAAANYARLHVAGRTYLIRETMGALEERLDPARFLRIHRSLIVAIDRVRGVEPLFQGEFSVRLRDGTRLTSSRGYRERVQHVLAQPPRP
jgi:two-component system LytT family response regulator